MFKKLYIILIVVAFFSCNINKHDKNFEQPNNKIILQVTAAVLNEKCNDSLLQPNKPIYISDSLSKLHLTNKSDSVTQYDIISYLLKDSSALGQEYFDSEDSAFIVMQEKYQYHIKLDSTYCQFKLKPLAGLKARAEKVDYAACCETGGYFDISVPVFSTDNKTALVSVSYHGFTVDSFHKQLYLLKYINNNWQVILKKTIAMA